MDILQQIPNTWKSLWKSSLPLWQEVESSSALAVYHMCQLLVQWGWPQQLLWHRWTSPVCISGARRTGTIDNIRREYFISTTFSAMWSVLCLPALATFAVTKAAVFSEGQQSLSSHCSKRADKELQSLGTVRAISDLAGTCEFSHTHFYTINIT